jgi:tetratricopeptide (TPR) repeat protein
LKIDKNKAETFSRKPEQCYDYAVNVAMKHRLIAMGGRSLVHGYRSHHDYLSDDFKDLLESGDAAEFLTMYRRGDYNERFEAGEILQRMGINPNDPLDFMDNFIENENIRKEINNKRKSGDIKNRGNVDPKIIIYTMYNCDYSRQAKQYLNLHGYEFEERKLEDGKEWLGEMLEISGNFAGTPVIRIDRADGTFKVIKGFTEDELDAVIYEEDLFLCRSSEDKPGEANCLKELGDVRVRLSKYPEARARYEDALLIYHALGDQPGEANTLGALGIVHYLLSEFPESHNRFQEALSMYRTLGDQPGEAVSLEFLGDIHGILSEFPEARSRYEEALLIFRAIGDQNSEANCILSLGDVFARLLEYPQARARYEEALPIFRALANRLGEANSLQRLGDMAAKEKDFDLAQKLYEDSISMHKEISPADAAVGYNNLGSLYVEQKEYTKAIQAFSHSLEIIPENAYVLRNRAEEYIRLKQVEAAAADLERAANLEPDHPFLFLRKGDLAIIQGNYLEAIEHLSKATEYDPPVVEAYLSIGLAYLYLAKVEEASSAFQKGLADSETVSDVDEILSKLETLRTKPDIQEAVENIWRSIQKWKISKASPMQK